MLILQKILSAVAEHLAFEFQALSCEVIQSLFPAEVAFSKILHTLISVLAKIRRWIMQATMHVWDHLIVSSVVAPAQMSPVKSHCGATLLLLTRIGDILS